VRDMKHAFSVELKSKEFVKNMSISDEAHGLVLIEGNLGELQGLSLVEGDVLEFVGVNGIFRIDVSKKQLGDALSRKSQIEPSSELGSLTSTKKENEK